MSNTVINEIKFSRKRILKKINFFFKKNKKKNKKLYSYSSLFHFSSSEDTLGYSRMNFWLNRGTLENNFYSNYLKNILSISYKNKYLLKYNKNFKNYDYLVITWAYKKNFKNGTLKDRYFNLSSKKFQNILWIVIYMDENIPNKLDKNIALIYRKKNFNPLFLIKYLFNSIKQENFNIYNFLHKASFQTFFAFKVFDIIKKFVLQKNIKKILMPYEGQPFQNFLCFKVRELSKSIETIGYVSHTHPFQLDIYHREGAPNKIFTHSPAQLKFFKKYLKWPKKKLKLIPSLRYSNIKLDMKNKIFFPYKIKNHKKILKTLDEFLKNMKTKSLPTFSLAPHPAPYSQKSQFKLAKDISKIFKKYQDRFDSKVKKSISLVIGLSTSVFLSLEKKVEIIHISLDPIFDKLSKSIWPNVSIEENIKNVYFYKLKKKGSCIKIKNDKNLFNKFFLKKR